MWWVLVKWQGEAASEVICLGRRFCWSPGRGVSSVSYRRTVRLILAGWLPQGEVFGCSGAAGKGIGRHTPRLGRVAHGVKAGHST
jgi:hypothetical protein